MKTPIFYNCQKCFKATEPQFFKEIFLRDYQTKGLSEAFVCETCFDRFESLDQNLDGDFVVDEEEFYDRTRSETLDRIKRFEYGRALHACELYRHSKDTALVRHILMRLNSAKSSYKRGITRDC